MRLADSIRSRIAMLFQRSQMRAEMEEELRPHIQHRADDLERSGMGRSEAERRARIEFGGREKYKEQIHQAIGGDLIETCVQDLRFSLRQLRKSPAFTCAAVMTLALAIGANAVVFGLMDGLILRPLNVPQYKTLYGTQYGDNPTWQGYPNYVDLRNRNHSFDDLAAFNFAFGVALDTGDDAIVANGFATTGNYFDVLGIHPYLGSRDPFPTMYIPIAQMPDALTDLNFQVVPLWWILRSQVSPYSVRGPIELALGEATGGLPVAEVRTMDEVEARDTARQRFNMVLLAIFGIAGLLMGAIGVYGVMSHSVQQRTQEMGVRMALGAQTSDLRRMVIAQGMRLALFGLSAGLGGAFYLTRFLSSFLFGIEPWDPVAFIFTPATSRCSCIFCHLDPGTQSNSRRSNDGAQARIVECGFNSSKRESQCLFVGD